LAEKLSFDALRFNNNLINDMNKRQGFRLGLNCYTQALSFMLRNKLGWYFIFPLVFNLILFLVGFFSISALGDQVITWLNDGMNIEAWDFWGSGFVIGALKGFIWIVIRILFFLLYAYLGGYIIIILMSPVFAFLSEETERIITGESVPFNLVHFGHDIVRGVLLAMRNLAFELLITLLLFIVSFIPVVGYFTAIALFLVSAYFYGFSFLDYTLERRRFKIASSVQFMRRNKGLAIGNGFVFSLVLLIPYIGVMLAGFVSLISVVAATMAANTAIENDQALQ